MGNLRTALLVWLQMRHLGGRVILRIEDLDTGRCREAAEHSILQDLSWLGLDWDAFYRQSDRTAYYAEAMQQLQTYPCSCSRKDIQEAISAPHGRTRVYPGTCLSHPLKKNRPTARRWHTPEMRVCVEDLYQPALCYDLTRQVGDFVLQRNDGAFAYHLAVVVDDGLMGVTHVVRGKDLWRATPQQVALQTCLSFPRPLYGHVPLLYEAGKRMAKRDGSRGLTAYRAEGMTPQQVLSLLARSLDWDVPDSVSLESLLAAIQRGEIREPLFDRIVPEGCS